MSSHREAPEISKDPVADGTDVYAFVSPNRPEYVTLIANFIPLQKPDGGPNFYEFGDDVLYEIHVNNRGDATRDVSFQFKFTTKVRNDKTFLYNTGQITTIGSPNWNRPQFYSLTRVDWKDDKKNKEVLLGKGLRVPPVNVGPRSTPDYAKLSAQAVQGVKQGIKVFCGQRADAFHVDLGSIFDLGALRPLNEAHLISMPNMNGVNSVQSYNVHTIALEIPIKQLTRDGSVPKNPLSKKAVIGVWATASRRKSRMFDKAKGKYIGHGPWEQVSRLANPLFNEVIVPMAEKDEWNARPPWNDKRYAKYVNKPELAGAAARALPGGVPEPREVRQAARRPQRRAAHRDPEGRRPRVPELHGRGRGGHAPAQRRDPADGQAERPRSGRGRRGRLAQRSSRERRRGHGGAASGGGADPAAGRPVVQAGRCRLGGRGRHVQRQPCGLRQLPVPGAAGRRLPDGAGDHDREVTARERS